MSWSRGDDEGTFSRYCDDNDNEKSPRSLYIHIYVEGLLGRPSLSVSYACETAVDYFVVVFSQTHEWWDDDPELDDDTREEINNFEVWLEGPTLVHYHERAEGKVEFEDEHMQRILDDLECRVVDEAILGQYVNEVFQFDLPGFTGPEQREKQFPEL